MSEDIYPHLRAVFGRYKAEWLRGDLFRLFQTPGYFPELEEPRPTVLVGGRGTGKTTVLKCLSYEGRYQLEGKSAEAVRTSNYVGLYWCIDSNRVTAFSGPELTPEGWQRLFGHYANLEIVSQICEYVLWYTQKTGDSITFEPRRLNRVTKSLNLSPIANIGDLAESVNDALVDLEATINAIGDHPPDTISLQGAPIQYLIESLVSVPVLADKVFYILIDEYENLSDDQQRVINTLLKHGRDQYAFKIGVKESGWRTRATLTGEALVHPADYDLIDLSNKMVDGAYESFARQVCNARLERAAELAGLSDPPPEIGTLLESLSADEEATLLGIERRVAPIRNRLQGNPSYRGALSELSDLQLYFLDRRSQAQGVGLESLLSAYSAEPRQTLSSYRENYRQALLYTVSEHSGRGVQKYYAGWRTIVKVSGGNIRYLVEIVERAFELHEEAKKDFTEVISAREQTEACIAIGRKYTQEVQALDPEGARLTYLLLGLGRFFHLLARHSEGKQPDTTSFVVSRTEDPNADALLEELLRIAVMHQVLRRWPATKLTSPSDAKENEYSLHPVFSAFFVFPYQKKRRIRLSGSNLLLVASDVKAGLKSLLESSGRPLEQTAEDLPTQLSLFQATYA